MRNIKLTIEYDGARYDGWQRLGKDSVVATVFADDNKKYLSTDLFKNITTNKQFISENVKLISYEAIK